MKIASHGITDVGKKRSRNEDCFLINEDLGLYVLADGMGGHSGGQLASKTAVNKIEEVINGMVQDTDATMISGVNTDDNNPGDELRYAIQLASEDIFGKALDDPSLKGMGTTTVAIIFHEGSAYIANVGDSRAYLIHANKIEQVTNDHSLVNEQYKAGLINKKDIKKHKYKNIITRSVGYQEEVEIDIKKLDLHMGDKILLCSDGLSNLVEDNEMETVVNGKPLKEACKELVDEANKRGGDDNITVVLTEVVEL